ncbi:transporter substrate-binding domain-containing protein [Pseudomonas sp. WS 5411]|uniref:ATP-binding protein n=1 Tax=Pseudomonas sp. WS 5411 TaxID=2717486 RepID=UPI0021CD0806|nr:transporter substrate-binding domain-containing protein [Pseudomonas sp. WS 5411]
MGDLRPIARQQLDGVKVRPNDVERAWLGQKQTLIVGVTSDSLPPYRIFSEHGSFEGLTADYLAALQQELAIEIKVRPFATSAAAFEALRQRQVDLVANATPQEASDFGVQLTPPYGQSELALFADAGDLHEYSINDPHLRIAVASRAALSLYKANGSQGTFNMYATPLAAMASVLTGDNDAYLGDTLSTYYLSSQLFSVQFEINQSTRLPKVNIAFAIAANNPSLAGLLERGLGSITPRQMTEAQYFWGDFESGDYSDFRVHLTNAERTWINNTGVVNLAISEDLAPYAFFNSNGRLNGIASDLLGIIRRKTDIHLNIIRVRSLSEVSALLDNGNANIGILTAASKASAPYLLTRAMAVAPYLFVMRQNNQVPLEADSTASVAVAKGYMHSAMLARQYPHVRIENTETMGEAFKLVREGTADFVLAPANVARYYLSYKYESSLKIGGILNVEDAKIVFAAPGNQPELISIFNKAMIEIPPRKNLQIIGRWRANSATDDKYWEGIASYIWRSFEVLGALLLVTSLLIVVQRRRIAAKRRDLEQRQLLLDELQIAKESAEKASRSKSVFLATMSHEIRTPLNAIIGMLELALIRKDNAELNAQSLHIAYESSTHLLALIGAILDISRIESGKLTLSPEPTRIRDLLETTTNVFSGLARQKGLHLHLDIAPLATELVWVDALKVKQIISNLMSNAIKFTEQGGVNIRCQVTPVNKISLQVLICVSDTGVGIPAAKIDQIFKPFYITSDAIGDPNAGAGLGLAICKELSNFMGGHLEVESDTKSGTRMTFSIVLDCVRAESHIAPTISGSTTDKCGDAALTVLIVEDHLPSQYLLYQQLSYLGHNVVTASNGLEGLAMWQENEIDIVLTDVNMPQMTGLEMTQSIRRLEQSRGCRPCIIIGLTADAQREAIERCLASGTDYALTKPITLPDLNRWIPKLEADQQKLNNSPSLMSSIHASMVEQVIESNDSERIILQQSLKKEDLNEMERVAHKLKGTAYLLNHSGFLEQCVEVEELCAEGIMSVDIRQSVADLIQSLETINESLRPN